MNLTGTKDFLFRHVEKIILALVILFVCYRVYANLFPGVSGYQGPVGPPPVPPAKPTEAIGGAFGKTAGPLVNVPSVERARYDWFYPPAALWGRSVVLEEGVKTEERRQVPRKVIPADPTKPKELAVFSPLSKEEREERGLPAAMENLKTPCEVEVTVESGGQENPNGNTLVIQAKKPGFWVRVMVIMENQDRFYVPVLVNEQGITVGTILAMATIEEKIKEEPLGTVVLRFTAQKGQVKSRDGKQVTTFIEPTDYLIFRKGEHEPEVKQIGKVPGRIFKSAEPGSEAEVKPTPKGAESAGFPGGKAPAPRKKEVPPPRKGEQAKDTDEMAFSDTGTEEETKYTYFIRSILVPKEEEEPMPPRDSLPREYKTLEKFSFAFVGGDAGHASIIVYIGPRDKPDKAEKPDKTAKPVAGKLFERIPIGGWVGDMPAEFRDAPPKEGREGEAEAAPPKVAAPKETAPKEPEPKEGAPKEAAPAAQQDTRFVTRYILVDIEQNVLRLVPVDLNVPGKADAMGRPVFNKVKTFRETQDRRAILRDKKNRLHYLWLDHEAVIPAGAPEKGKAKAK